MALWWAAALLASAPVVPWSPPVQAEWTGKGADITAVLSAPAAAVSMRGKVSLVLRLAGADGSLRVSPFINASRGVAFEVTDRRNRIVGPREPMAGSPPPPPLASTALVAATPRSPMTVAIGERAATLFPGPGRYHVRAIVSLMDIATSPARYRRVRSNAVAVTVVG